MLMKIAILGGTGKIGRGLALRWAAKHEILVGSRRLEKAEKAVEEYKRELLANGISDRVKACDNGEAAKLGEVIVIAIPYEHVIETLREIKGAFKNQIVVSTVVPLKKVNGYFAYTPPREGSAAVEIRNALPKSVQVTSAFHTVSSEKLADLSTALDNDVVICGDDAEAKKVVAQLVKEIRNLRPLDGGPLELSGMIEAFTPLLVNIGIYNRIKNPSIRFV